MNNSPKISVVTPSYNQGKFIEQTIQSVLSQNYPNLEYIVIDGGSTDNTLDIIKKYSSSLSYWISEKDSGQSEAINKGFDIATGDILCWINSDDMLSPNALFHVAQILTQNSKPNWLIGGCKFINDDSDHITDVYPKKIDFDQALVWSENSFPQPAVFWNRAMWNITGKLDNNLHYAMDFDLWLSMFKVNLPLTTQNILGINRCQTNSKTSTKDVDLWEEMLSIVDKHTDNAHAKNKLKDSLSEISISCHRLVYSDKVRVLKRLLFAVKLRPTMLLNKTTVSLIVRLVLGKKLIDSLKVLANHNFLLKK